MIGVAAISIGVVIFRLFLQRELSQLAEEITAERQQIESRQDIELKLRDLGNRADVVSTILSERKHYSRLLEKLTNLLPEEVNFARLQLRSLEAASLSGNAFSYIDLARFIEAIQEDEEMLDGLQLRSVNLDAQTGRVSFDLDINIKEDSLYGT